jgi:hypothetical protein
VIIDFRGVDGELATLSLQVKSSITISAAASNKDFRPVVIDAWKTFTKPDFRVSVDRVGVAFEDVAKDKSSDLRLLLEFARASTSTEHFEARFADGGNASATVKVLKQEIASLLQDAKGETCSNEEVHGFLAHFVLIQYDFMHAGSTDSSVAMNQLREILAPSSVDQAPLVLAMLHNLARDAAGKSGEFRRQDLVKKLSTVVRVRGAQSLRPDLAKITELSTLWSADIENDVGGTHLERAPLTESIEKARANARFVEIKGLPGTGKSALLRKQIEADLLKGPVLFLKSDRLEGRGWSGFASANGLSPVALDNLLSEIAAAGSSTFFVDGIDRIEKQHQGIVLDVLRAIESSASLDNWRVVVSLRDSGIEPLRHWTGGLLEKFSRISVQVGGLSKAESDSLLQARPELRPLFVGSSQVAEIVRRPFFAKVLCQGFPASSSEVFLPQSEVDLADRWWTHGGYDTTGQLAIARQQAIIELGNRRAMALSKPVAIARLSAPTQAVLQQLVDDGVLKHVRQGHTINFAHDIFFEWSFLNSLATLGDAWIERIRECGEPPAVGRVVELLAQNEYQSGQPWAATLKSLSSAHLRSQWIRAWLLAPTGIPSFANDPGQFRDAVLEDDNKLLKQALVWFQAEKTIPNPHVLATGPIDASKIRLADLFGLPSDFSAWRRFIEFLLAQIPSMPVRLLPDVVALFEVWQNATNGVVNHLSSAILNTCAIWLRELDITDDRGRPSPASKFATMQGRDDFKKTLSTLVLRAAASYPAITTEYIQRVITLGHARDERVKEIVGFSPILVETHARLLSDLVAKHLLQELPDEQIEREHAERERDHARREEIKKKPEAERTQIEKHILSGMFSDIGGSTFSLSDWDRLSIERDYDTHSPASPLREPFHSLFKSAPDIAIALFNRLCNHAITAWRQLHAYAYDWQSARTPLPVVVRFPWGEQRFWGGTREYEWCRGVWQPSVIACGFMAYEKWCLDELERGVPADDLIKKVVTGNECVGVLGLALLLAMHTETVSETTLALVATQSLWGKDEHRMGQDFSLPSARLVGFDMPADKAHIEAMKELTGRVNRRQYLQEYAKRFVLDATFSEATRHLLTHFKNSLPYEHEEQRSDAQTTQRLLTRAAQYAQLADLTTYRAISKPDEQGMISVIHVDPSANSPERLAQLEDARLNIQDNVLWAWASKIFQERPPTELAKLQDYIKAAKAVDNANLLGPKALCGEPLAMRRGAVTGVAAVVLRYREGLDSADLTWARDALSRAFETPEIRDALWVPSMHVPWHQGTSIARGYAAEVHCGTADDEIIEKLICLVAHPLNAVSLAAQAEVQSLWSINAKLSWTCFCLALSLCVTEARGLPVPEDEIHPDISKRIELMEEAAEFYFSDSKWHPIPDIPAAWVSIKGADYVPDDFNEDSSEMVWIEPSTRWDAEHAAALVNTVRYREVMASDARPLWIDFLKSSLKWTLLKHRAPGRTARRNQGGSADIFTWTRTVGATWGAIGGLMTTSELVESCLNPVFASDDDECLKLLATFGSAYAALHVLDAPSMPSNAGEVLGLCQARLLKSGVFEPRESYRRHTFSNDVYKLVQTLMFSATEGAGGAARFANGDWKDIDFALPFVDNFVAVAGWSSAFMTQYLTLCERSVAHYPALKFADQVLLILEAGWSLYDWHGTFIAARIASLVQQLAHRETPMSQALGGKMLKILDVLVDMGDRRSAALQQSEIFREVQIGPAAPLLN